MDQRQKWDVIIVGAGALGSFHALFVAQKGLRVLLLEKDLRPSEATVRNFGQVIPSGMKKGEWFEYGRTSLEHYKSIQQEFDISVRRNGTTYLASTAGELQVLAEKAAEYRNIGYECEELDREQCLARFQAVKSEYCIGGLHFPQEVSIEPESMIHRLHQYLIAKYRVDYRPCTPVRECVVRDGQCEATDSSGHKYQASKLFICNGRDFKFLMPDVFSNSDLDLVKLQMMSTYPMKEIKLPGSVLSGLSLRRYKGFASCPSYSTLTSTYLKPDLKEWGIHVLFKQALDGSIIIGDSHEYAEVSTCDSIDYRIEDHVNQLILDEARQIVDLPSWAIRRHWNGFYSQSRSSEIFQKTVDNRIHIVTGIGGKGMTTSCGFSKSNIERLFA